MSTRVIPTHMNTTLLAEAVAAEADISNEEASRVLFALCDVVARNLAAGESIAITNFGTWYASDCAPRKARNPQTGETVTVEARRVVRWRTSPRMAEMVRAQDTSATLRKRPSRRKAATATAAERAPKAVTEPEAEAA